MINYNDNNIYNELISRQLNNINFNKLSKLDLLRISNKINNSIFTENCCIYQGNIIIKNNKKYIPFFYNYKKVSLTRILYNNFIININNNNNLLYTCENKGQCCSLNHMKLKYFPLYLNISQNPSPIILPSYAFQNEIPDLNLNENQEMSNLLLNTNLTSTSLLNTNLTSTSLLNTNLTSTSFNDFIVTF